MQSSGFFQIGYSAPFVPGATASHQFAVGHNQGWPIGSYAIRIRVDSEDAVKEYSEKNNISSTLRFDVLEERYLAGTLLYNSSPLSQRTTDLVAEVQVKDMLANEFLSDFDFWYDVNTGHYYFSNLPETVVHLWVFVHHPGQLHSMGGGFRFEDSIDLRALPGAEAGNYDLDMAEVIHLIHPWDNTNEWHGYHAEHCGRIDFQWESLVGAAYYEVKLERFRSGTHPDGYGRIETIHLADQGDTEFSIKLPVSFENEHYQFRLRGFNSSNEFLGEFMWGEQSSYGWDYRFRILGDRRPIADINGDCHVNMIDLSILARHWLESELIPASPGTF